MESIALTFLARPPVDDRQPLFTARWSAMVVMNFEIEASALAHYVPPYCEPELRQGSALVSLVGTWVENATVHGIRIPLHSSFERIQLRSYVRARLDHEWRRGVISLKEIVPRRAVAFSARALYRDDVNAMQMRHTLPKEPLDRAVGQSVSYGWRHNEIWSELRGVVAERAVVTAVGSESWFVSEHARNYAVDTDKFAMEYTVDHPRWPVAAIESSDLKLAEPRFFGDEFREALTASPRSAFFVVGSEVSIHSGEKLQRSI